MKAYAIAAATAAAVLAQIPMVEAAEAPCGPRSDIVAQLTVRHSEQRVAIGLVRNGQVMELWMGPAGSWTLLASMPSGVSCVVAAGEHLELSAPQAPADPA